MLKIINLESREQLNSFLTGHNYSQFLQSWQWGEFQGRVSGDIFRLGIEDNGKLVAVATLIKKKLPIGKSYFFCPRGPVIASEKTEVQDLLFIEIANLAKKENAMFVRIEPLEQLSAIKYASVQTKDIEPSLTLMLDLSQNEEKILSDMGQKTRYNVRLAEKHGVKIIESDVSRFQDFWQLMCDTGERDDFRLHGIIYYDEMLNYNKEFIKLFFAEYQDRAIATSFVSFFGDTVTYIHGASANLDRQTMAPYLLHWHCIKEAKAKGFHYYDFYGIDEKKWPGVTRFKKGFGGFEVKSPGTFDIIFDQGWYNVYKMVRGARRKLWQF
jgi:lipid II:glycine glycyltransferase (peptidoglycan interpeptide bridge formation enzyme)